MSARPPRPNHTRESPGRHGRGDVPMGERAMASMRATPGEKSPGKLRSGGALLVGALRQDRRRARPRSGRRTSLPGPPMNVHNLITGTRPGLLHWNGGSTYLRDEVVAHVLAEAPAPSTAEDLTLFTWN